MSLSRRRFITISAAAAGLPLLSARAAPGSPDLHVWRGAALGADAVMQIHHSDRAMAEQLVRMALAEIERLERIFSLYRTDSAIVRLNRDGTLDHPPADLVTLLSQSLQHGELTGGAFDVTVQPLWQLYADHFSHVDAEPAGPDRAAVEKALSLIDYRAVSVAPRSIRLERPGMAITLNGVAQGYVTDRVVELLRREGIGHSLVDIGEIHALGPRPDRTPWRVGIEDPQDPTQIIERVSLDGRAISTSGGYGLRFDPAGRFNHLLDPHSGGSAHDVLAVSVIADTATIADAMSTAFCVMPPARVAETAKALRLHVRVTPSSGARPQWIS
jgi:thiamine biosynthesis lipoprotein